MFGFLSADRVAGIVGMARLDPAAAREKWATRTQAAVPDYVAGVQRVSRAPGQMAAEKKDKYIAGIQENTDKWQRNVARVGLAEWQEKTVNIGANRIASGVQEKGDKYESFAAEFYPHLDAGVARVKQMRDTTLEDRMQRAVAMMRHNASFKRRG